MSLLDINGDVTPKFLKSKGFRESGWGSPRENKRPENRFFEKVLLLDHLNGMASSEVLNIMYFPKGFNGYIMLDVSGERYGRGYLQGQCLVQFEGKYANFHDQDRYKIFDMNTLEDYQDMLVQLSIELNKKELRISKHIKK